MSRINKLPEKFTRKGYTHTLLKRTGVKAVYEVSHEGVLLGWEVGKVLELAYPCITLEDKIHGHYVPSYERQWKDEDFGRIAWYYSKDQSDKLEERYNSLGDN